MPTYLITTNSAGDTLIVRRDADGTEWWLGDRENDAGYQAWVAEGNKPEPWNPEPAPSK